MHYLFPLCLPHSDAHGHVLQHEDCQSAVVNEHSVLMLSGSASGEPESSLSDRLSNLARRLDDLRTSIPVENEAMPAGDRAGSEAYRMAMSRTSCSGPSSSQQDSELADLRTLRPPTPVHHGIWYGRLSGHWSSTRPGGTGSDGVAGDLQGPRDQREDLQREAHGDPWPLTGGDERQGANNGAGQGRREAGRSLDGQFDLSPKPGPNDTISGIAGDETFDLTKEEIPGEALGEALGQARDQDRPGQGGDQGERPAECEGDERELKSVLLSGGGRLERSPSSPRTAGESEQGRSPAHQGRAGGEGPGGRVMALWESLKSLRVCEAG